MFIYVTQDKRKIENYPNRIRHALKKTIVQLVTTAIPVSYTHLDVYKRQLLVSNL